MSWSQVLWDSEYAFKAAARDAVTAGLMDAVDRRRSRGESPDEPDYIAGLVRVGAPILAKKWGRLFRRKRILFRLTSVFCHQSPQVRFSGMTKDSVELGDLLIAHVHRCSDGVVHRNALLLQSKMIQTLPAKVKKSDLDQLTLYRRWPDFEYVSAPLAGRTRSVAPKMPHEGGQYLVIPKTFPSLANKRFLTHTYILHGCLCMADRRLTVHGTFPDQLFHMLTLLSGRSFEAADQNGSGWSAIIWDLIDVGIQKAFNRRRAGYTNEPRWGGDRLADLDGFCQCHGDPDIPFSEFEQFLGPDLPLSLFSVDADVPETGVQGPSLDNPLYGVSMFLIETFAKKSDKKE